MLGYLLIFVFAYETEQLLYILFLHSARLVLGMVNIGELFYCVLLYLLPELLLKGQ